TNLALGFLTHVFEAWTTGRIAETTIKVVFPSILDEFILGFTIDDPNSSKPERISCLYSAVTPLYPSEVVNLFRRNASLGFWDYTNKILDKLQEKACNTVDPAKPFATFHLPFAKALYENPDLLPESSPKHDFIKFILTSYRDHFFQPRLTLPADWAREKGGCGCEDCERLDSFLVDPASVEIWIPAAEDRIDHLSRILPRLYGVPACETQTSERDSVPGFLVRKKDYQWRRLVLDWEEDQKAAGETLEKNFDQTKLKDILGDGYRKFFGPSMEWSPLPGE
ncbi:hypothetical protein MMC16_000199, partial [Acarospora aff. strigata]|nr:hypothetical protein [Acarospora aff. strigata]